MRSRLFEFEQTAFAPEAPSVTAERSAGAKRAMAWDQERDRVCANRRADRASGARLSDSRGYFPVGARRSGRYRAKFVPYPALERRAAQIERERRAGRFAVEESDVLFAARAQRRVVTTEPRIGKVRTEFALERRLRVAKSKPCNSRVACGEQNQAERRFDHGVANCSGRIRR